MSKIALLVLLIAAGCGGARRLPPAKQPTQYVPDYQGAIPVAPEPGIARILLDAHDPDGGPGERGRFWVYLKSFGEKSLLCAEVPCIFDAPLASAHQLMITNYDIDAGRGTATGYFGLSDDRNLFSYVMVTAKERFQVMIVNVGRDNGATSENFQEPGVLVFVPPEDVQARFLPAE